MRTLLMIAIIAAIVLGAAYLFYVSRQAASHRPGPDPDDPKEILRRRYAAGEIDEDEYLRRMSGLSQEW